MSQYNWVLLLRFPDFDSQDMKCPTYEFALVWNHITKHLAPIYPHPTRHSQIGLLFIQANPDTLANWPDSFLGRRSPSTYSQQETHFWDLCGGPALGRICCETISTS